MDPEAEVAAKRLVITSQIEHSAYRRAGPLDWEVRETIFLVDLVVETSILRSMYSISMTSAAQSSAASRYLRTL